MLMKLSPGEQTEIKTKPKFSRVVAKASKEKGRGALYPLPRASGVSPLPVSHACRFLLAPWPRPCSRSPWEENLGAAGSASRRFASLPPAASPSRKPASYKLLNKIQLSGWVRSVIVTKSGMSAGEMLLKNIANDSHFPPPFPFPTKGSGLEVSCGCSARLLKVIPREGRELEQHTCHRRILCNPFLGETVK